MKATRKSGCGRVFHFKTAKLKPRSSRLMAQWLSPCPSASSRSTASPPAASMPRRSGTTSAEPLPAGALQLYLREIGQVKLLTPQEESALAKRIKRGDKKAREHMIQANLRLVVKIAREYEGLGLPLLDLINEGNIGLMKSVDRFDVRKGAKFSTYASWWI